MSDEAFSVFLGNLHSDTCGVHVAFVAERWFVVIVAEKVDRQLLPVLDSSVVSIMSASSQRIISHPT